MSDIPPDVQFRSARRSLISTMELYGIDPTQAEIQVDSLVEAVRRQEQESAVRGPQEGH